MQYFYYLCVRIDGGKVASVICKQEHVLTRACLIDNINAYNQNYNRQGYYYSELPASCVKRVYGNYLLPGSKLAWTRDFPIPKEHYNVSRVV